MHKLKNYWKIKIKLKINWKVIRKIENFIVQCLMGIKIKIKRNFFLLKLTNSGLLRKICQLLQINIKKHPVSLIILANTP